MPELESLTKYTPPPLIRKWNPQKNNKLKLPSEIIHSTSDPSVRIRNLVTDSHYKSKSFLGGKIL